MRSDAGRSHSRQLLALSLLVLVVSALWSARNVPAPNSDRYDYLGRAHHVLQGEGARPLVVYPLRFAFPGADRWPVENLSRPPLWPVLVAGGQKLTGDDDGGVLMASAATLCLLLLVATVGDRTFGAGAGGFAALAIASSFATVRGLWGGGPELSLAALVYLLWTWSPAAHGRAGIVVAGLTYGLLPWLHPVGALFAVLAFFARGHRSSPAASAWIAVVAVLVAMPWYAMVGRSTGVALGPLQAQAELAKSVLDPGGLGPYRSLEPLSAWDLLRTHPEQVARAWLGNLRHLALHLDAWLAWPVVALGLWGVRNDPRLALRDLLLLLLGFAAVALVARDPRLLLPLLPVACTWCGAGWYAIARSLPRLRSAGIAAVIVASPWVLPLGLAVRPGDEFDPQTRAARVPSEEVVARVGRLGEPGRPFFTDHAVLAWRSRRPAVFLPDSPATLRRLRAAPPLSRSDLLVVSSMPGSSDSVRSWWAADHVAAWDSLLAEAQLDTLGRGEGAVLAIRLPPP